MSNPRRPYVAEVVRAAARVFNIPVDRIIGPSRRPEVVHARHIAMYVAREDCGDSYPALGRFFHRDHTTVLLAVRTVSEGAYAEDIKLVRAAVADPACTPRRACDHCRQYIATIERLRAELADVYSQMELRRSA